MTDADRIEILAVLKECRALFADDHALSRFDWAKSYLRAQDVRELNELPFKIRKAIRLLEGPLPAAELAYAVGYCTLGVNHDGPCNGMPRFSCQKSKLIR